MNVRQLLTFHEVMCREAHALCERKNSDYAGSGGQHPFRNFTAVESLGLAKTEVGLVVRMVDKINRLVTFLNDGKLTLENEGAHDSLLALINYAIILGAYIESGDDHADD